jgi:hypothetical protein
LACLYYSRGSIALPPRLQHLCRIYARPRLGLVRREKKLFKILEAVYNIYKQRIREVEGYNNVIVIKYRDLLSGDEVEKLAVEIVKRFS